MQSSLSLPLPPDPDAVRAAAVPGRPPLPDPIETMRGLAVLLLVGYHVIGSAPGVGLRLDYPHPLRIFADLLIDLRMPMFAFIAGYVYGLRPVRAGGYARFAAGKLRRLAIPGAVAVLVFAVLATAGGRSGFAVQWTDAWRLFVFPYAHYWFLQAILLIFLAQGAIDIATGHRAAPLVLGAACVMFLLPTFPTHAFSVNSAVQLFPFFLLGLTFLRHRDRLVRHRRALMLACLAAAAAGMIWNLDQLASDGRLPQDRRDLQSLASGMAICLLAVLAMPRIAALSWIGPPSFTIYLYHVLGTASTREALYGLGVTSVPLHYVLGVTGGILMPVALHLLVGRNRMLAGPLLGLWRQDGSRRQDRDPAQSRVVSGNRSAQDS